MTLTVNDIAQRIKELSPEAQDILEKTMMTWVGDEIDRIDSIIDNGQVLLDRHQESDTSKTRVYYNRMPEIIKIGWVRRKASCAYIDCEDQYIPLGTLVFKTDMKFLSKEKRVPIHINRTWHTQCYVYYANDWGDMHPFTHRAASPKPKRGKVGRREFLYLDKEGKKRRMMMVMRLTRALAKTMTAHQHGISLDVDDVIFDSMAELESQGSIPPKLRKACSEGGYI